MHKIVKLYQQLEIEYYSFSQDALRKRVFRPYMLEIKNGCWYAIGYCEANRAVKELRVSRIKSIDLTNQTFNKPKNFHEVYNKNRFNEVSGMDLFKMKLKFKDDAARFIKEFEKEKADKYYFEDNILVFEKEVSLTIELERWILSFGPLVEVVEPAFLKKKIINYYKDSINAYE